MKMAFLILSTIILAVFITGIVMAQDMNSNEVNYVQVIVKEGDTLWNIAKPFYNGKNDFREFIDDIRELNNLEQAIIYPGQTLNIPANN